MTERFVTGIVGAPFGLKGFVKVKPLSGDAGHLLGLKSVTLRRDGEEKPLKIEESAAAGPFVTMRFEGVGSPEEAKALRGAELLVSRKDASPLEPGEFYVEDLKGLDVVACGDSPGGGKILGSLSGIIEGGGGDLAEIRLQNGKTGLVPFRKEFIAGIDLENGRVTLKNTWILE